MIRTAPDLMPGPFAALRAWCEDVLTQVTRKTRAGPKGGHGHVTLLGAGPGSADLITLRGLAALQCADVIFYDRLVDPALLAHAKPGAALVSVGKTPGRPGISQDQINDHLIQAARDGRSVVRLKCGDPGIFGRGAEEAQALTRAGHSWSIIPGVTAACAAAAAADSFLTERDQTERVVLVTGQRRDGAVTDWTACAAPGTTLACYMAVGAVTDLQSGLLAAGWPHGCAVEIISQAQRPDQRILRGTLGRLAEMCQADQDLSPAILLVRWPAVRPLQAGHAQLADVHAQASL